MVGAHPPNFLRREVLMWEIEKAKPQFFTLFGKEYVVPVITFDMQTKLSSILDGIKIAIDSGNFVLRDEYIKKYIISIIPEFNEHDLGYAPHEVIREIFSMITEQSTGFQKMTKVTGTSAKKTQGMPRRKLVIRKRRKHE